MSDNMNDDIFNIDSYGEPAPESGSIDYHTTMSTTHTVPIPHSYGISPTTATTITNSGSTITLNPTHGEDLHVEGDITVGGISLKDFMESVSDRLSILTPDPRLLEKYDALKEAYEHYKILEKLCTDDDKIHEKT